MEKEIYLKDKNDNYYYEADYNYLIGPVPKEKAQTMSEICANSIIAKNPDLIIEVKNDAI